MRATERTPPYDRSVQREKKNSNKEKKEKEAGGRGKEEGGRGKSRRSLFGPVHIFQILGLHIIGLALDSVTCRQTPTDPMLRHAARGYEGEERIGEGRVLVHHGWRDLFSAKSFLVFAS